MTGAPPYSKAQVTLTEDLSRFTADRSAQDGVFVEIAEHSRDPEALTSGMYVNVVRVLG